MKRDTKVKKSGIAGRGVIANRDYAPGEQVLALEGKIVHYRAVDWDNLGEDGMNYLQVSPMKYLEPTDPNLRFLNHSCNPNLGYRNPLEGKSREIKPTFFALRPIRKGEEVQFDYSTTMLEEWDEDISTLERCQCGSKNCRGCIKDFKNLPKADQERYIQAGAVPDYILRHR